MLRSSLLCDLSRNYLMSFIVAKSRFLVSWQVWRRSTYTQWLLLSREIYMSLEYLELQAKLILIVIVLVKIVFYKVVEKYTISLIFVKISLRDKNPIHFVTCSPIQTISQAKPCVHLFVNNVYLRTPVVIGINCVRTSLNWC